MAQWIGKFCGFTHETKVRDAEESLRLAVTAAASASAVEGVRKSRAMLRLGKRLLNVRLKALHARMEALSEQHLRSSFLDISNLQKREQELMAGGVEGILKEFGAPRLGR